MWKLLTLLAVLALAACESAQLGVGETSGAQPQLPPPTQTLLPTLVVAPARPWEAGEQPEPAPGFAVTAFASGLDHPRWLHVLPNGDVLVAETNAPPREEGGFMAFMMRVVGRIVGASGPSANRITLLRDADGDGVAEYRSTFAENLHSPFGMALAGGWLYVANTDALVRFPYTTGAVRLEGPGERVLSLPAGPLNYHWTKNVIASPDGSRLYVTIGSNSNVGEYGLNREAGRARVLEVNPANGSASIFAFGLRNPNGLAWEPVTGKLWTTVNERDGLGSDVPPDYMTSLQRGGFYGWPHSYYGAHIDPRVPERPELVASALVPDYALGPHTASLGLAFYEAEAFPPRYRGGAFVGQHGSWNRRPPSGYRVVFVPFAQGRPAGPPEDFLTGFVNEDGKARGRPVGVAVDAAGGLLVADDVGNTIWRVTPL